MTTQTQHPDREAALAWAKIWSGREAARYLLHLESENERLKNDLADSLDLKNGCGPTVLTALSTERNDLRAQLAAAQAEVGRLQSLVLKGGRDLNHAESERRIATEALAAFEAERGRLEDLIVDIGSGQEDGVAESRAILAERTKEPSHEPKK